MTKKFKMNLKVSTHLIRFSSVHSLSGEINISKRSITLINFKHPRDTLVLTSKTITQKPDHLTDPYSTPTIIHVTPKTFKCPISIVPENHDSILNISMYNIETYCQSKNSVKSLQKILIQFQLFNYRLIFSTWFNFCNFIQVR